MPSQSPHRRAKAVAKQQFSCSGGVTNNYPQQQQHLLCIRNSHDLVSFLDFGIFLHAPNLDLSCLFTRPRLFATHLPFVALSHSVKTSTCKIVYLCRNTKDTFVSYWNFSNKVRSRKNMTTNSLEDVLDLFCRGVSSYGLFWDHVIRYWRKSLEMPHGVLFLKYEGLKQ